MGLLQGSQTHKSHSFSISHTIKTNKTFHWRLILRDTMWFLFCFLISASVLCPGVWAVYSMRWSQAGLSSPDLLWRMSFTSYSASSVSPVYHSWLYVVFPYTHLWTDSLILLITGTPTEKTWPGITTSEEFKTYNFPLYRAEPLVNHAPRYAEIDVCVCCSWNIEAVGTPANTSFSCFWLQNRQWWPRFAVKAPSGAVHSCLLMAKTSTRFHCMKH